MSNGTHLKGPLTVAGVEVVDATGAITGDIQATALSIGTNEIANNAITSGKMDPALLKSKTVTLTPTTIVGTAAGDIAATAGTELVAAEAGMVHLFDSAVLSYAFDTAAYTGGGDDLVIRQGTTAVSAAIAKADLLADTEDDIAYVTALSAADIKLTANSALNIFATTAYTNPGTAAGTCKVTVFYRTVPA